MMKEIDVTSSLEKGVRVGYAFIVSMGNTFHNLQEIYESEVTRKDLH